MSELENNTFTNKANLEYPSLEDTADIRVINNNIKILNETKADLDNLGNIARETKPNNIEDIVIANSIDIKELKENLSKVLGKINDATSNIQNIITASAGGISHNAFMREMALNGRLFVISSLHSSNVDIEITFPNYTRVVSDQEALYVDNDAPSVTYPGTYNSIFYSYKAKGDFLFSSCHCPIVINSVLRIYSTPLETRFIDKDILYTTYPVDILNSVTRTDFGKSHYVAFVLNNTDDLDKITVQVKDIETNEILNNVAQLSQVTSISFKRETHIGAPSVTNSQWTYSIIKTF